MADNNTVARPYAQAIFEVAEGAGALGDWSESLGIAGALLADKGLVEYLRAPEFNDEQRLESWRGCSTRQALAGWPARTTRAPIS